MAESEHKIRIIPLGGVDEFGKNITTIRVHFSWSSDSDTFFCVRLSSALVASSNISIRGFGAIALAIIRRCR